MINMVPQKRARSGFTLIELLVVIAIIAILAAILFPVFAKAREKARQTTCMNNQKQIATSILMFVQDHDETFPNATTWLTELAGSYGVTGKVWDCPTTSFKGTESAPDYFYVAGSLLSDVALGDIKQPADAAMLADMVSPKDNKPYVEEPANQGFQDIGLAVAKVDPRHNKGAVFAFVDGHMQWVAKEQITGSFFMSSVSSSVEVPVFAGSVMTPTITKLNMASEPFRADMERANLTIAVGSEGANRLRINDPNGEALDANAPAKLPSWIDATNTLPRTTPATEMAYTNCSAFLLPWYTGKGILRGLNLPTDPEAIKISIAPATGFSGAKRVGIAYGNNRRDASFATSSSLTINRIRYVDIATGALKSEILVNSGSVSCASAKVVLKNIPLMNASTMNGTDWSWCSYTDVVGMVIPFKSGTKVEIIMTMDNPSITSQQLCAGNGLLLEP